MSSGMAITVPVTLAVILGLIVLAGQVAQRMGFSARFGRSPKNGPDRRISLLESFSLDARRRLLLVRCNGHDLLLLVGGPQDLVIHHSLGTTATGDES